MKIRVRIDQETYDVEISSLHDRPIQAIIDGEVFEVWPEDAIAPAEAQAAPHTTPVAQASSPLRGQEIVQPSRVVSAPIPGVILSIQVKVGDSIAFGQELCVLEAMKMKNQIRANRTGIIATVQVSPGDQVRHGQVLFEYSE